MQLTKETDFSTTTYIPWRLVVPTTKNYSWYNNTSSSEASRLFEPGQRLLLYANDKANYFEVNSNRKVKVEFSRAKKGGYEEKCTASSGGLTIDIWKDFNRKSSDHLRLVKQATFKPCSIQTTLLIKVIKIKAEFMSIFHLILHFFEG